MSNGPKMEVPPELRTIAEQGVDQARAAMDGLISAAHKTLDDAGRQFDMAHDNARDLSRTTLKFAEDNISAAFDFAARLAKASTVEDWSRLQADYVREQAERLTEQSKALGSHAALAVPPVPPVTPAPKPGRPK